MNLYVANDTVVQKVTPTGLIRLCPVASRLSDYCHNTLRTASSSGLATTVLSNLNPPRATGDVMGGDGSLYVTDRNSSSIYRVTLAGVVTTVISSADLPIDTVLGGPSGKINSPSGLALLSTVNSVSMAVVDSFEHAILCVDLP